MNSAYIFPYSNFVSLQKKFVYVHPVIRLLHVLMVSSICVEVNKNWVNILIDANECAKYINKI